MTTTDFVARARELHKNEDGSPKYRYDLSIYTKSANKLKIECPEHGVFEQTANSHLSGHGCKKCATRVISESVTLSRGDFIARCEALHPNLLDYSEMSYSNTKTPATFICKVCGYKFVREPSKMLQADRGHGCTQCNGGIKDTLESFIAKARSIHGAEFNYDAVDYKNSTTHVLIACSKGHTFSQTPSHHLSGDKCPVCRGLYRTTDDIRALSASKFGSSAFDFAKACVVDMKTPITLVCPAGHEFVTTPSLHLREGSDGGCRECATAKISASRRYDTAKFVRIAISVHGALYSYDRVNYVSSQIPVIIVCLEHGAFNQRPSDHLRGKTGCRECANEAIRSAKLYSDAELASIMTELAETHSGRYTYEGASRNDDGYLTINAVCPSHGRFTQRLDHHRRGHGCTGCVVHAMYSKKAIEWLTFCSISGAFIQHAENGGEYKIPGTPWRADGFDPHTNTVSEFLGDYWHGNPLVFHSDDIHPHKGVPYKALYEKTQARTAALLKMGFTVVEMWEFDWDRAVSAVVKLQRAWKRTKA